MSHLGIISPPVSGHLNPFGALGRALVRRGHRVTLVHMVDLQKKAADEGLEFCAIGGRDHPAGSLPEILKHFSEFKGLAALRFTLEAIRKSTEMICRDAPDAIRKAGIDYLLVDQTEPAGAAVADYLNIPYITVCNALALNRERSVPPPFTSWSSRDTPWVQMRNRIGYLAWDTFTWPIRRVVANYRRQWKLAPYKYPDDSFSRLAQISQQPPAFDFPRHHLPETFHYVGPLRDSFRDDAEFPWDRLDSRPMIYASLGTLQNRSEAIFRCIAQACQALPIRLIISHGGGLSPQQAVSLPGNPLVVSYAPQQKLLAKARLTITHGGLNTILDSLSQGVPVIAIPLTYEQPAIGARLVWTEAGRVIPYRELTVETLRKGIKDMLTSSRAAESAAKVAKSIRSAGGVVKAADIIESMITLS